MNFPYFMTPEQIQEIIRLRALNLSPKQIARKLGLSPAAVSAWLKNQAEEAAKAHLGKPLENLPPIEFGREGKPCYVSGPLST